MKFVAGVVVVGRRGAVVECGTTASPRAGIAIGVVAAGGKVGKAGTPPSGADGFIGLRVGRGGAWAMGGVEVGGVPMMRIGFGFEFGFGRGCWCGIGSESRYEPSWWVRSSRRPVWR